MFQRRAAAVWKKTSCLLLAWNTQFGFSFQHHLVPPPSRFYPRTATISSSSTNSHNMPKPKTFAKENDDKGDDPPPSGIMMILSPAKTLDLSPLPDSVPQLKFSNPDCNLEKTREVAKEMKSKSQSELAKLLGVSANLAKTSHEYWQNFEEHFDDDDDNDNKPSIYSFSGAAYQGLQVLECSKDAVLYLQDNLRIVDPLYGVLRPLDKMQPYRLEMATKHIFKTKDKQPKLSEYWKPAVTEYLGQELNQRSDPILLNLASDEYAAAVHNGELEEKVPGVKYIKAVFRDQGRVVAVHAKRARGLMARFLAESNAQTLEDIRKFEEEGYKFVAKDSDDSTLVFDRPKQETKKKDAAAKKRTISSTAKTADSTRGRKRSNK